MKRFGSSFAKMALAFCLAVPALSPVVTVNSAHAQMNISVLIDGKAQVYEQSPIIVNDRVMVPMRSLFESLGAKVEWDASTKTVYATKGSFKVELSTRDNVVIVNHKHRLIDQPPIIRNDRMMVPVRAVSESLQADVQWNGTRSQVLISTKNMQLFDAIDQQDTAQLQKLLQQNGLPPEGEPFSRLTPVQFAFEHGKLESAKILLEHGADPLYLIFMKLLTDGKIEATNYYVAHRAPGIVRPLNYMALVQATQNMQTELVNSLLKQGIDPNSLAVTEYTDQGQTTHTPTPPLKTAIDSNNLEMVEALLQAGADGNTILTIEDNLVPILLHAAEANHVDILRALLAQGARPDQPDSLGWTALMVAAENGNTQAVNALLAAGAQPNVINHGGATALMIAEKHGNQATVQRLQTAGASRNSNPPAEIPPTALTRSYDQKTSDVQADWTPLMKAAYFGQTKEVKSLLAAGANPFTEGTYRDVGRTALDLALLCGNQETLEAMLNSSLSLRTRPQLTGRLIYDAVRKGNPETVRLLLKAGILPTEQEYEMAMRRNNLQLLQLFHEYRPITGLQDQSELTLLLGVIQGHTASVEWLLSTLRSSQVKQQLLDTNLIRAAVRGNLTMMRLLLKHGADPNFINPEAYRTSDFQTALEAAKSTGFQEVVTLVEEAGAH